MADVKISALTAVVTPATTDIVPVVQGGVTKQETVAQIRTVIMPVVLGTDTSGSLTLAGDASGTTSAVVNDQARGLKSATTTVSVSAATAPTSGQVLTATAGTTATWQTPAASTITGTDTHVMFFDGANTPAGEAGMTYAKATDVLSVVGALAVGTTPATTGTLRFANGSIVKARDVGNTNDRVIWEVDASNQMFIGTDSGFTATQWGSLRIAAGDPITIGTSVYQNLVLTGSSLKTLYPIIGHATAYGIHGVGIQAMADANQTPSSSVYCYGTIRFTGSTQTAVRTATVPSATDAASYTKVYQNAGTTTFDVTVTTGSGTTVNVAPGCVKTIRTDAGGCVDVSELAGPRTQWGTTSPLVAMKAQLSTTDATLTTIATYPIPASTIVDFQITIVGIRTGGVSGTAGDSYRAEMPVTYQRIAGAGPTLVGAAYALLGAKSNGGGSGYVPSLDISSNDLRVRVTGVATTNINWTVTIQGQECT